MADAFFDSERFEIVTGGDKELQRDLIADFTVSSQACLAILSDGKTPHAAWTAASHRLKGAAANMGGVALVKVCEQGQHAAPDIDKAAAVAEMTAAYGQLMQRLKAYCGLI